MIYDVVVVGVGGMGSASARLHGLAHEVLTGAAVNG